MSEMSDLLSEMRMAANRTHNGAVVEMADALGKLFNLLVPQKFDTEEQQPKEKRKDGRRKKENKTGVSGRQRREKDKGPQKEGSEPVGQDI
jgi:hypothetical protein